MHSSNKPVFIKFSLIEDPQVQRTRRILSIILGTCICLSVLRMISVIFGNGSNACLIKTEFVAEIVQFLSSILAYSFGLFVTRRYYETGLRIFAWLIILELVIIGIGIIIVVLIILGGIPRTVPNSTTYKDRDSLMIRTQIGALTCAFIYVFASVLDIIIAKFAFKLINLIGIKRSLPVSQI
ncbi:unnamed protein product [Rotaria sordida]|uniref:Uncharacterized protein n=1 Tax=Rotaria sordida TaxID=392033 RepID=A0A814XZJ3_9BILA|nr:unnamed protein product [Rotaria sordida]CAF1536916.1 unnamed protein product [Rotaria sordida]